MVSRSTGADKPRSVASRKYSSVVLPRRWARRLSSAIGVVVGACAGVLYARAMSTQGGWAILAIGGLGGAALGFLAVAIPRVALHYLLREWYRTVAGHWRAVVRQRAERARRQLQREDSSPTSILDLGIASHLLGRNQEAAEHLRQTSSDDLPSARNALAVAEAAEGHWVQAVHALAEALEMQSDYSLALHNLIPMLAQVPRDVELPAALASAVERADSGARNNIAVALMLQDNLTDAREQLQLALAQQALHPAVHANLAVLAFWEGDVETAVTNLAAAAQFAPTDAAILSNLGGVLSIAGDYRAAETVLTRAQRLDARQLGAIINHSCLLLQTGSIELAMEKLAHIPSDHRLAAIAAYDAAVASASAREWEKAREYAGQALADKPDDPRVLSTIGAIHWHLRDYEQADTCLLKAVELAPRNLQVVLNAVRTALSAGREAAALELIEDMPDDALGPDGGGFDLGVGWLLVALGRRKPEMNRTEMDLYRAAVKQAMTAFEETVSAKQGPVAPAHFNLGLANCLLEEYEAAGEHFEASAKLEQDEEQDESVAHFCAGTAFATAGFRIQTERSVADELVPEARQLLRRARQHLLQAGEYHSATADVFSNLGTVCYQLGQMEEAMKALRRLVQLESSAAANNSIALAFARQGQDLTHQAHVRRTTGQSTSEVLNDARRLISSAVHYFAQALQFDPLNPVLHSNMGLAYMLRNGPGDLENALHHWHQMRAAGDAWAERQFARMMQVMENQQTARAQFHDIGRGLRPIEVEAHVRRMPPVAGAPIYVVEPVMEDGLWELETAHRDLRIALRARHRLDLLEKRMQRLSI
ncbi:MAG: hypothetical protein GX358_11240 [candidate division WS1 bacterium]|nr:hypothetical protein [candidate division WS1 bacterium]